MRATINGIRMAIVALVFYWVLLFIGTHLPADRIFIPLRLSDKVLHAIAFAGLSFLIAWAVPTNDAKLHQNTIVAALIAVVYAALDELLQIPVGRTADWLDFAADCVGVCIGLGSYTFVRALIMRVEWEFFRSPSDIRPRRSASK